MKKIINESSRADVTFIVEDKPVHAHRAILFCRCRALEEKVRNTGHRSEEKDKIKWGINADIHIILELPGIRHKAFLGFIEWLYTDNIRSLKNN